MSDAPISIDEPGRVRFGPRDSGAETERTGTSESAAESIAVRPMTPADIPFGLSLCRASGWNQTARDWQRFVDSGSASASLALRGGRPLGTVAAIRYGAEHGWIAMMLVAPAERRRGVGTALMARSLSLLADVPHILLDATPAGERIYARLGFIENFRLTRMERSARPAREPGSSAPPALTRPRVDEGRDGEVRLMQPADVATAAAQDRRAFGADRGALLAWLREGAPEYAWLCRDGNWGSGFVLGRHGHDADHLGPVVADSLEAAQQLVLACLAAGAGRRFILDAPDERVAWLAWLGQLGFSAQRPFVRMSRGERRAGAATSLFASAGPEFG